ncbi:MAG TPA: hypothetical protein DCY91_17855 [Cyanobacteria bacterium UBA11370]|nr:hypothetical protein [Cyanobacteria bacterium UBA11370]HBY79346.1 hypothetical protein [Cyanobacteria bacterium UBA11148]
MEESAKMIIALSLYIFTIVALGSKVRSLKKTLIQKETEIKEIEAKLKLLEKAVKAKLDINGYE